MLIDNNLLKSKSITINVVRKFVYIRSCDVIVDIEIKITCTIDYKRVYVCKVVDILSRLKIAIFVYYITIFID